MQIVIKSQTLTLDAAGARAVACELFDLLLTQFATDGFQNEYNGLTVCQEAIDETTKLSFSLNILESTVVLSYNNKFYNYRKGLFTEAFGKAKAERERKGESESRVKPRKQAGVIDSVIKIIRFNRNEE